MAVQKRKKLRHGRCATNILDMFSSWTMLVCGEEFTEGELFMTSSSTFLRSIILFPSLLKLKHSMKA